MTTKKEMVIPDYLKELIEDQENLGESSASLISQASSVPRISLKSNKFRFIEEGEEVNVTPGPIKVIILGVQPERNMAKTFYLEGYNPENTAPPDCSSSDGLRPDSWVPSPQAELCAKCPQNVWGSAISKLTQKKIKACRDSKRLIVIDATKGLDSTAYILNITVSSLGNLSEYGKFLAARKLPFAAVLTEISLDDDSDYQLLHFNCLGFLKKENGLKALERSSKKEWLTNAPSGPQLEHKPEEAEEVEEEETPPPPKKKTKPAVIEAEVEEEETPAPKKTKATAKPQSDVDDLIDGWEE